VFANVQSSNAAQKGSLTSGQGWSGISHRGGMPDALLLVAWPEKDAVKSGFYHAA
jgi:cellobiose dehydrogenase (acceptor)